MKTRRVTYSIEVTSAWCARCVSPISGEHIVRYADEIADARRAVDLALVREAHERGLTVAGRFDPKTEEAADGG